MNIPFSNPLYLFRAILREASYLPDLAARKFHAQHVALSFRRHRTASNEQDGSALSLPSKDESYQMKRARKYLYMLQRANQGYSGPLENILKMAYARKGKRRRQLLQDLLLRDPSDIALQSVSSRPKSTHVWQPPFKFHILLRKQNRIQQFIDTRRIRALPKAPTHNRWNKPFPIARAQKMAKKWFAKNAAIIQAPLTEAEWLMIYRKVTGQTEDTETFVQKRRQVASVRVFAIEDDEPGLRHEVDFIGCTSTQRGPPQQSKRIRSLLGNPHKFTRRFLRRIMQRSVLQASPTLIADVKTGKLAPRWDLGSKPHIQPQAVTSSQSLTMFG